MGQASSTPAAKKPWEGRNTAIPPASDFEDTAGPSQGQNMPSAASTPAYSSQQDSSNGPNSDRSTNAPVVVSYPTNERGDDLPSQPESGSEQQKNIDTSVQATTSDDRDSTTVHSMSPNPQAATQGSEAAERADLKAGESFVSNEGGPQSASSPPSSVQQSTAPAQASGEGSDGARDVSEDGPRQTEPALGTAPTSAGVAHTRNNIGTESDDSGLQKNQNSCQLPQEDEQAQQSSQSFDVGEQVLSKKDEPVNSSDQSLTTAEVSSSPVEARETLSSVTGVAKDAANSPVTKTFGKIARVSGLTAASDASSSSRGNITSSAELTDDSSMFSGRISETTTYTNTVESSENPVGGHEPLGDVGVTDTPDIYQDQQNLTEHTEQVADPGYKFSQNAHRSIPEYTAEEGPKSCAVSAYSYVENTQGTISTAYHGTPSHESTTSSLDRPTECMDNVPAGNCPDENETGKTVSAESIRHTTAYAYQTTSTDQSKKQQVECIPVTSGFSDESAEKSSTTRDNGENEGSIHRSDIPERGDTAVTPAVSSECMNETNTASDHNWNQASVDSPYTACGKDENIGSLVATSGLSTEATERTENQPFTNNADGSMGRKEQIGYPPGTSGLSAEWSTERNKSTESKQNVVGVDSSSSLLAKSEEEGGHGVISGSSNEAMKTSQATHNDAQPCVDSSFSSAGRLNQKETSAGFRSTVAASGVCNESTKNSSVAHNDDEDHPCTTSMDMSVDRTDEKESPAGLSTDFTRESGTLQDGDNVRNPAVTSILPTGSIKSEKVTIQDSDNNDPSAVTSALSTAEAAGNGTSQDMKKHEPVHNQTASWTGRNSPADPAAASGRSAQQTNDGSVIQGGEQEHCSSALIFSSSERPSISLQLTPFDISSEAKQHMDQQLVDIYTFYNRLLNIPHCAEKSLAILHCHFQWMEPLVDAGAQPLLNEEQTTSMYKLLEQQLKYEGLDERELMKTLREIKEEWDGEPDDLANLVWKSLKQIRPVDVDMTIELLRKANQTKALVEGKHVTLLLGGTGTGKSTTVHFLAGSAFENQEVNDLPHLVPTNIPQSLEEFSTSPSGRSETRSINAITLSVTYQDKNGSEEPTTITLCDSPGFGDTEGSEFDIVNGIGVAQAVRSAASVRPVVLVSKDSGGDRFEGLVKLVRTLTSFLPSIGQHLGSFTYCFTKYSRREAKTIHAKIRDKYQNLNSDDKSNRSVVELLKDMKEKTKDPKNVIIIDPLEGQPKPVLDHLAERPAICNPQEVFQDFTGEESLRQLSIATHKLADSVKTALSRGDLDLADYRFCQIENLNSELMFNDVLQCYENVQKYATKHLEHLFTITQIQLDRISATGNHLGEDLKELHKNMTFLSLMEPMRSKHLPEFSNLTEWLELRLRHFLEKLYSNVCVEKDLEAPWQREMPQECSLGFLTAETSSGLDKLSSVELELRSGSLNDARALVEDYAYKACQYWDEVHQNCYQQGLQALQNKPDVFVFFADQLLLHEKTIPRQIESHLGLYDKLMLYGKQRIERMKQTIADQLPLRREPNGPVEPIDNTFDAQEVSGEMSMLQLFRDTAGIGRHLSTEFLTEQIVEAQKTMTSYINGFIEEYLPRLWQSNDKELFPFCFGMLSNVEEVKNEIADKHIMNIYQVLIDQIKHYIDQLKGHISESLNTLCRSSLGTSCIGESRALLQWIEMLDRARIFKDHEAKLYHNELEEIKGWMRRWQDRIGEALSLKPFDIKNPLEAPNLLIVRNQLEMLRPVEQLLDPEADLVTNKQIALIDEEVNSAFRAVSDHCAALGRLLQEQTPVASAENLVNGVLMLHIFQTHGNDELGKHALGLLGDFLFKFDDCCSQLAGSLKSQFHGMRGLTDNYSGSMNQDCEAIAVTLTFLKEAEERLRQPPQVAYVMEVDFSEQAEQARNALDEWLHTENGEFAHHRAELLRLATAYEKGEAHKSLDQEMEAARLLKRIDCYLNGENTYASILFRLEAAFKSRQEKEIGELKVHSRKGEYQSFFSLYGELKDRHPEWLEKMQPICRDLVANVQQEVEEIRDKIDLLTLDAQQAEKVKPIVQQVIGLQALNGETKSLRQSILPMEDNKWIDDEVDRLSRKFQEKLEQFHKSVEEHIKNEQLLLVASEVNMVDHLIPDILELTGDNWIVRSLNEIAGPLRDELKRTVHTRTENYKKLSLTEYRQSPPQEHFNLLDRLQEQDKEEEYKSLRQQLSESILGKIKHVINLCRRGIGDADVSGESSRSESSEVDVGESVQLLQDLRALLPPDLVKSYDTDLDKLDKEVKAWRGRNKRILDDLKATSNLEGLVGQLLETNDYYHAHEVSSRIASMMQQAFRSYEKSIRGGYLADILQNLTRTWDSWQDYYEKLLRPKKVRSRILFRNEYFYIFNPKVAEEYSLKMLSLVATECRKSLDILNNEAKPDKLETLGALKPHLSLLRELFVLYSDYGTYKHEAGFGHLYESLMRHTEEFVRLENFKETVVTLKDVFTANQKIFEETLESTDLTQLAQIMARMEEQSITLELFKETAETSYVKCHVSVSEELRYCSSYSEMRESLAQRLIDLERVASQKILEHPRAMSSNFDDRQAFYHEISNAYTALKTVRSLIRHVDERMADVNTLANESYNNILQHLNEVKDKAAELIECVPSWNVKSYTELNTWYDNLRIAAESFESHSLGQESQVLVKKIDDTFRSRMQKYLQDMEEEVHISRAEIIERLIALKMMGIHAPTFKVAADEVIDKVLDGIRRDKSAKEIGALATSLKKRDDEHQSTAQRLIAEHDTFKHYMIELRNEKTLSNGIEYVLKELGKNDGNIDIDIETLSAYFSKHEGLYWEIIQDGLLDPDQAKKDIVQDAKQVAAKGKKGESGTSSYVETVIDLVAKLFAYWTLSNTQVTEDVENEDEARNYRYLLQPHAAQVISILRLLGLDASATDPLQNHLVQIGTGEGKSVTMAVTASVLSLMGYDVDCACYSEYLSARDYHEFLYVFAAFGLRRHITYGTFNQLCENWINRHGDVRQVVTEMVSNGSGSESKPLSQDREKIIIIDEVDVFFSKDFYGNFYRPLAQLQDEAIQKLIEYVWSYHSKVGTLKLKNVQASAPYKKCSERFAGWENLLEEAVKAMIVDLLSFSRHKYQVINDQIAYTEQHGVSFDVSYRYKTIFAYCNEHERGAITKSSRDKRMALLIDCGTFSYAEIPKQYKSILGVTGTLSTLSSAESELLRGVYEVRKFTYMPSCYGKNELEFSGDSVRDVQIDSQDRHHIAITNEIKARHRGTHSTEVKRPVMVFFDSLDTLLSYYRSKELQTAGINDSDIKLITEKLPDDQKAGLISQATGPGIVTLLTRKFGRGTDFKCYDDNINANGGVHVIQTFVSDELSEETQIMGRTARQGDPGSFSMVLDEEPLERYKLRSGEIEQMRNTGRLYSTLNDARCRFFHQQYNESLRYVNEIKEDHDSALEFLSSLFHRDSRAVRKFLEDRNAVPLYSQCNRTICLMDGTGSMAGLITKTKNTVDSMFFRARNILEERGIYRGFEMQLVIFRNYDQKLETLLQSSDWESDPNNLREFISTVEAFGGTWRDEAIEIALWHANRTADSIDVDQVILIGDAPPNTRDEVERGREKIGESYWQQFDDFKEATHVDEQLDSLVEKEIPVHAFYVRNDIAENFGSIARKTRGQCAFLDIDSDEGAEQLTHRVTERILHDMDGEKAVESYRQKYVKGYVGRSLPQGNDSTGPNNVETTG